MSLGGVEEEEVAPVPAEVPEALPVPTVDPEEELPGDELVEEAVEPELLVVPVPLPATVPVLAAPPMEPESLVPVELVCPIKPGSFPVFVPVVVVVVEVGAELEDVDDGLVEVLLPL